LEREVPRHDGADDADRFLPDLAGVRLALLTRSVGQLRLPGELVDQLGRVAQRPVERPIELWALGGHAGAADLEDQLLSEPLPLRLQSLLQLLEAVLPERAVSGPLGLVERPARGIDGAAH